MSCAPGSSWLCSQLIVWPWLYHFECGSLPSSCLSLVPHLISVIHKVKNNHWLTLTKILQPSDSTFVKLDLMIWKEPSSTFIWWLDVLFPQIVSPLRAESSQRETQFNGKSIGFDVGYICIWISNTDPPSTGCFALNKTLDIENN